MPHSVRRCGADVYKRQVLMSMLYGAEVRTMMPKLHSAHFPGMELIRPLYLVREADILSWQR